MRVSRSRAERSESGQSLVELGLSLVVVLLLLAGIVDLGRLLFFYIAMRDAAQEGAIVGELNPRDCNAIESRVDSYLGATYPDGFDVNILVNGADCFAAARVESWSCEGRDIMVTVGAPFEFMMPLLGGRAFKVTASITGTVMRPACP